MTNLNDLGVQIFADGADLTVIAELCKNPLIKGFTTNPSLMRKASVRDYQAFAFDVLQVVRGRPISFEVFSDEAEEMEHQALEIASWGGNVFVKIPVTNTRGEFLGPLIERLSNSGVQVNVTALLTTEQVSRVSACLSPQTKSFVSVFAGRIADTGKDPVPVMAEAVRLLKWNPNAELIWASPRELLNIFQAESVGCHVITATSDILNKLQLIGKNLAQYSLETVQMFYQDALEAGFRIQPSVSGTQRAKKASSL